MKILQVIPALGIGGAEVMYVNLLLALKKLGHDVVAVVLSEKKTSLLNKLYENDITVKILPKKVGFSPTMIFKLFKLFRAEKPDVVHTHLHCTIYAFPAALISKVKVVTHTLHSIASKECSGFHKKCNYIFYKYFNVIPVALSNEVKNTVVETYKLSPENVPAIYNGIDIEAIPQKVDYKCSETVKVVHVGRFVDAKNHINLIRAFKLFQQEISNSELILIGDGELRSDIENEIKHNNLTDKVCLVGASNDVYRYLINSDVFVLPSIYEGMPMTVIEAMRVGIPIVVTDVGGISEMVRSEISALFCKKTPESICSTLKRMVESEDLRKQLSATAKEESCRFTSECMALNYIDLYTKTLLKK